MRKLVAIALACALLGAAPLPAPAKNPLGGNLKDLLKGKNVKEVLKDAVKVAGVGLVVDQIAKPLNDFINQLMLTHGAANKETTKVVPILTVGQEGHIGAAQVCGPQELVDKVKAVIQFEDTYEAFGKKLRVRALVPNATKLPTKIERVYGVGVTATIDLPL